MAPKPAAWQVLLLSVAGSLVIARSQPQYATVGSVIWSTIKAFFVAQLILLIWQIAIWPTYFSPLRKLPHPKASSGHFHGGWLFFGQFFKIFREVTGAPMREWMQTVPNDGLISYTTIFGAERVLLTSPDALREVLVSKNYDFIKPSEVRFGIGRILGIGILLAEGDEHKRQRKLLNPAFAFRHIKDLYSIFWSKARASVNAMGDAIATQPPPKPEIGLGSAYTLEVGQWASRTTLDIIGLAGMGQDFGAIQNPSNRLTQIYRRIFTASRGGRLVQILGIIVPLSVMRRLPMKRNFEINQAASGLKDVCRNLIADKRAKLEKGTADEVDILSVAMESGGFSDDDLVNQLLTFLAAGHETTATTMTWAIYYLCKHPEIQQRLRDEIRAKLPSLADPDAPVGSTDIDSIPYLHAVCNEVLRIFPPVQLTLRVAASPQTLLGHPIPQGTTIVIAPGAINVSPALWGPNAGDFDPERWMKPGQANTGGADSNFSFLTFLHGPRSCIGMAFAKAEFACLLAAWVGRYEFSFREGQSEVEIVGGVTSRPKDGLSVHVKPVEGW